MKKIILIIFISLLLSGCYDYKELNKTAIVTAIGVDYKDNEYLVTMEILSTKKEGETASAKSYTVSSSAKTFVEALDVMSNKLEKLAYYGHLDVVVMDEEIAKNHLSKISDHLMRCPKMRNEFYTVIIKDGTAQDVLTNTTEENPIASTFIKDLLENNKEFSNASYYQPFIQTLNDILTPGKDTMISVISKNEDNIELVGMGLFQDYKLKTIIDTKSAMIINLLNNFNFHDFTFRYECRNDASTVLSIYGGKVDTTSTREGIKIKATLEGWMKEENCGFDLRSAEAYTFLEEEFSKIIENEIIDAVNLVKAAKSNALSLGRKYYINTRVENYYKWLEQDVEVEIDLKINKKGLTFDIKGD